MRESFMRLFVIAKPIDKIRRLGITDPYLIFFINTYETSVDWNKIKSQEDLDKCIAEELLPKLKSKIDIESENNNYVKDIDLEKEFVIHNDDPLVQEAKRVYDATGDMAKAKKPILDGINEKKKYRFGEWWTYITTSELYKNNYAFQYCFLTRIIDSSNSNDRQEPNMVNEYVVATISSKIREDNGQSFNILKEYVKVLAKSNVSEELGKGVDTGWIYLPSKIHKPEGFSERAKKLSEMSKEVTGWCVGELGTATSYLSDGDFWMYVKNNIPVAAIRFIGDKVAEIRGDQKTQETMSATGYWEEVLGVFKIIEKRQPIDFDSLYDYYGRNQYDLFLTFQEFNDKYEEGKEKINNIEDYKKLSHKNRARISEEEAGVIADALIIELSRVRFGDVKNVGPDIPSDLIKFKKIHDAIVDMWIKKINYFASDNTRRDADQQWESLLKVMPAHVKNDPRVTGLTANRWNARIRSRGLRLPEIPDFVRKTPHFIENMKAGWIVELNDITKSPHPPLTDTKNTLETLIDDVPKEVLRDQEIKQVWSLRWIRIINSMNISINFESILIIPSDVSENVKSAWEEKWEDLLLEADEKGILIKKCPSVVLQDYKLYDKFRGMWKSYINHNATKDILEPELPPEISKEKDIFDTWKATWIKAIHNSIIKRRGVGYKLEQLPKLLQNNEEVLQAWISSWKGIIEQYPWDDNDLPPEFKRRVPNFRKHSKPGWIHSYENGTTQPPDPAPTWVNEDPDIASIKLAIHGQPFSSIPKALQESQKVLTAWRNGWIKTLQEKRDKIYFQESEVVMPSRSNQLQYKPEVPVELIELFGNDNVLVNILKWTWTKYLKIFPTEWEEIPTILINDKEIVSAWKMAWTKIMRFPIGQQIVEKFPDKLSEDPEFLSLAKTELLKQYQESKIVWRWDALPIGLKKDKQIVDLYISYYVETISSKPYRGADYMKLIHPDFQKSDPIFKAWKRGWFNAMRRGQFKPEMIPIQVMKDEHVRGLGPECAKIYDDFWRKNPHLRTPPKQPNPPKQPQQPQQPNVQPKNPGEAKASWYLDHLEKWAKKRIS